MRGTEFCYIGKTEATTSDIALRYFTDKKDCRILQSNNKSGYAGLTFHATKGKWQLRGPPVNKKRAHRGYYMTKEEAIERWKIYNEADNQVSVN